MAKNNEKQTEQEVEEVVVEETAQVEATEEVVVETEETSKTEKQAKPSTPAQKDKKQKAQDNKKQKDKKPSKIGKKTKETISELKKVNWPTFGQVCKKTGVVLAVVLIFAVVLFGIDRLLAWLFGLLTGI